MAKITDLSYTCLVSRPAPLLAAALALWPVLAAAQPAFKPEKNTIYLVCLRRDGKPAKAETDKMMEEANAIYKRLGLATRIVPIPGKAADFEPATLDEHSSFAIVGSAADIGVYVKKKDPDDALFLQGWGGDDEPERSQNSYMFRDKYRGGGRVITVDAGAVAGFASVIGWTKEQTGGYLLVHGSGHNSDLDGKLQHAEYGGIMTDGAVLQWQVPKLEKAFATVTNPARNAKLIAHLQERFAK
jgi:hypothetical protein